MAIDISGYATQTLQKPAAHRPANAVSPNDEAAKNVHSGKTESVNVSDSIQRVKEMIYDATGVDQEKIDRIKAMIADGSYTANADRTAERMINFEVSVFG